MFLIHFVPLLILFVRLVNTTQAGVENLSHSVMGFALQVFGVFVVMFFIMFIASSL
jgi:positive regulator of sigma E activity